jgi:uncharacterized membrane protein YagU involved in acid resistance
MAEENSLDRASTVVAARRRRDMSDSSMPHVPWLTIAIAGSIAGVLDIGAAALIYSARPDRILQAIAAGLLGRESYSDGAWSSVLGFVLQVLMSCLIAAVYVIAARRLPALRRNWIIAGLAYGVIVFGVMNYVVMPLSAVGKSPTFTAARFVENLAAMLVFGLIITFIDRRREA